MNDLNILNGTLGIGRRSVLKGAGASLLGLSALGTSIGGAAGGTPLTDRGADIVVYWSEVNGGGTDPNEPGEFGFPGPSTPAPPGGLTFAAYDPPGAGAFDFSRLVMQPDGDIVNPGWLILGGAVVIPPYHQYELVHQGDGFYRSVGQRMEFEAYPADTIKSALGVDLPVLDRLGGKRWLAIGDESAQLATDGDGNPDPTKPQWAATRVDFYELPDRCFGLSLVYVIGADDTPDAPPPAEPVIDSIPPDAYEHAGGLIARGRTLSGAFEDVDGDGTFTPGTDVAVPPDALADGEYDAGDNALVIPAGACPVTAEEIDLKADGVTVEVDLTATDGDVKVDAGDGSIAASEVDIEASGKVELKSKADDSVDVSGSSLVAEEVKLDSDGTIAAAGATLTAEKKVELKAKAGVDVSGSELSGKDVKIDADGDIVAAGSSAAAEKKVELKAKADVDVSGSELSGKDVKVDADGAIQGPNAALSADKKVELKAKADVDVSGSELSGKDVKVDADGDIDASDSEIRAEKKIELKAKGEVNTSGATLDAKKVKIQEHET